MEDKDHPAWGKVAGAWLHGMSEVLRRRNAFWPQLYFLGLSKGVVPIPAPYILGHGDELHQMVEGHLRAAGMGSHPLPVAVKVNVTFNPFATGSFRLETKLVSTGDGAIDCSYVALK
eukprot:g42408.t1